MLKSSVISGVKSTAFMHVFTFAFSYVGTSKENGLVLIRYPL